MVPTKERNHSSILISHGNEGILIDCGEGTQRQLKIAGIKLTKITRILISHWHGDHVLGLPGLIQSMVASDYNKTLYIYGPKHTKALIKKLLGVFAFNNRLDIKVQEITSGRFFENNNLSLESSPLKHGIETLGYSLTEKNRRRINLSYVKKGGIPQGPLLGKLQEGKRVKWKGKAINLDKATNIVKGKKLTIINDTLPCKGAEKLAKNSDLLICEATYSSDMEKKAANYKHMTSVQAGKLAKKSKVKQLVITHFSSRYKNTGDLEMEAKKQFKNVTAARDFMKIVI
jgi:ribonuclease Z